MAKTKKAKKKAPLAMELKNRLKIVQQEIAQAIKAIDKLDRQKKK